jgi:DNA polymerase-1
LRDALAKGEKFDFHAITAEMIGTDRATAKTLNFGTLYGMGHKALANKLGTTEQKAHTYIDALFDRAPKLRLWWIEQGSKSFEGVEFATTPLGRRRLVDMTISAGNRLWESNRSQLLNHPVQGACAEGYKLAGALIWEGRKDFSGNPLMVNMVHDEFVLETDADAADEDAAILKSIMVYGMKQAIGDAPIDVEVKVSDVWDKD